MYVIMQSSSQTLTLSQKPDLPSLIDPAEDLNLLTAVFLVQILWNFNCKHMAGAHKCFNILIRRVQDRHVRLALRSYGWVFIYLYIFLTRESCRTLQQRFSARLRKLLSGRDRKGFYNHPESKHALRASKV